MNSTLRTVLQIIGALIIAVVALKILKLVFFGVMLLMQLAFLAVVAVGAFVVLRTVMSPRS